MKPKNVPGETRDASDNLDNSSNKESISKPQNFKDYRDIISHYESNHDYPEMVKVCNKTLELGLSPEKYGDIISAKLRALKSMKHYKEAVATLKQATEAYPNSILFYAWLGFIYEEMDEHEKAVAALKQGLEIKSEFIGNHYFFARALAESGLHKEAMGQFEKDETDEKSFSSNNKIDIGECLVALGRHGEALETFAKAEERVLGSRGYALTVGKADALSGLGQHEEAILVLREGIGEVHEDILNVESDNEIDPDKKRAILEHFSGTKALLYYDVGIQLIKSGRKDEAIYAFENVIEFDKDATALLKQVFHILSEYSENLEDVLEICEEMISQRPNFKDAYYTKFNIEQKLGLYKDAENTRNEVQRIFGDPEPKKKDDMC